MKKQEMSVHIKRLEEDYYQVMCTLQQFFLKRATGQDNTIEAEILQRLTADYHDNMPDFLQHPDWLKPAK